MKLDRGYIISKYEYHKDDLRLLGIILLLVTAVFLPSLSYSPTEGDYIFMLSSVSRVNNPIQFFTDEANLWSGQGYYRPISQLSYWLTYQLFDVWSLPQQVLNLILHLINVSLLFFIARRHQQNKLLLFLIPLFYAISIYTERAVTWVPARNGLMVSTFLLILLNHISKAGLENTRLNLWIVAGTCIGALLSKESGLIVPAIAALAAIKLPQWRKSDFRVIALAVLSVGVYFLIRLLLLGAFASVNTTYEYSPIILIGRTDYYTISNPTLLQTIAARFEIVFKNALSVLLPVFNNQGLFHPMGRIIRLLPIVILTPFIIFMAARLPLTKMQWLGLATIALSSLLHYVFYSTYLIIIGHIGAVIFLAGSTGFEVTPYRNTIAVVVLSLMLVFNVIIVGSRISNGILAYRASLDNILDRQDEWSQLYAGINPRVLEQIVERYQ